MVDFINTLEDKDDEGPCGMLKEGFSEDILDMVDRTDEEGSEYAAIVVETEIGNSITSFSKGEEGAMLSNTMANLRMEATETASNILDKKKLHISEYETHVIHTHPQGHFGMSLRDMTSIVNNALPAFPEKMPKSSSVACATMGDNTWLGSLYRERTPTKEEIEEAQIVARNIEDIGMEEIAMMRQKERMIEELSALGFKSCVTQLREVKRPK